MTRTARHDADYFPFYVKEGKTLFILESKYGLQGIGFFTNLMRFLCKQPDHHICIESETDRLYFFAQIHCQEEIGMDMLNLMSKTGKIDAALWESRRVIVSQDFLDKLDSLYQQRINPIITIDQIRGFYPGKEITTPGKEITTPDMPQTKLKKTKVKKEEIVSPEVISQVTQIIEFLNEQSGKNFSPSNQATIGHIRARLTEGRTIEDFKKVITVKCTKWLNDPKMKDFVRPETLFGTKFEAYLNEETQQPTKQTTTANNPNTQCPNCKKTVLKSDIVDGKCFTCDPGGKNDARIGRLFKPQDSTP